MISELYTLVEKNARAAFFWKTQPLIGKGYGQCKNRNPFTEGLWLAENRSPISNKELRFIKNCSPSHSFFFLLNTSFMIRA